VRLTPFDGAGSRAASSMPAPGRAQFRARTRRARPQRVRGRDQARLGAAVGPQSASSSRSGAKAPASA
jgi:hypothetical protein